jgi:hypothetical protein
MSYVFYLIPVVAILAAFLFSRTMQQRLASQAQNMSPEQAQARINQYFASSFDLAPGESLRAVWTSEEFQGVQSAGRQVAGAALNSLARQAVGVSTYVPVVRIGLTTASRTLFSREYSELGERGNFKQIAAFEPGTQALDAAAAYPGQELKPPMQNPLGGSAPPEYVQFRSPGGQTYEVWLTAGQTLNQGFISIFNEMARAPV